MKLQFVATHGKSWWSKILAGKIRSKGRTHIAYKPYSDFSLIEVWLWKWKVHWAWSSLTIHSEGTKWELWELDVPGHVHAAVYRNLVDKANSKEKYDYRAIMGFLLPFFKEKKGTSICSGGCIAKLAEEMGWDEITPDHIDPQRFIEIIQAAGAKCTETGTI